MCLAPLTPPSPPPQASLSRDASGKSKASLMWSRTMSKGKELFDKLDGTQ
jgi:hypothetical protein